MQTTVSAHSSISTTQSESALLKQLVLQAKTQSDFERIQIRIAKMANTTRQRQFIGTLYTVFDQTVRQANAARTAPVDPATASATLNAFIAYSKLLEGTILSIESKLGVSN